MTTPTFGQHPDRAQRLLDLAEQAGNDYSDRVGGDNRTARSYEHGVLKGLVRDLCAELETLYAKRPAMRPPLDHTERSLMPMPAYAARTDEQRDAAVFARNTGAAAALRGEL